MEKAIKELFFSTFSDSEGEAEGKVIASLVGELMSMPPPGDRYVFVASENEKIVGAIFLTRITFEPPFEAFLLAPVAVDPAHQGLGIGQLLIRFGLQQLAARKVDAVFTYGDPNFYSKTGFQLVKEESIPAPFPLSQPEGWMGVSLQGKPLPLVCARSECVEALNKPIYW